MAALNNKVTVSLDSMDRRRIDKLTKAIERLAQVKEAEMRDHRALYGGTIETSEEGEE